MGRRVFGFHDVTLGSPRIQIGLSGEQMLALQMEKELEVNPPPVALEPQLKLYVMSIPRRGGGTPRVGEYDNTPSGHRELATLIRSEHVLSVVLGQSVRFEHASVVELISEGVTVVERQILPE